jgi:hypothetical protein
MKRLAINVVVVAVALCAAMSVGLATGSGSKPVHDTSGNLEGTFNGEISPKKLSKTKPSPVTLTFSARMGTTDGTQPPALSRVTFETDKHLDLDLRGRPRCSLAALRNTDTRTALKACPGALIGSGFGDVEFRSRSTARRLTVGGSEVLIFNGGTRHGVTTLLVHLHIPEPASAAVVFPLKVRPIKKPGRFGLSWSAAVPKFADGLGSLTSINLTFRKGLYATCPDSHFFASGAAEFADGNELSFRLSRDCIGVQNPAREAGTLPSHFEFSVRPRKLPRSKPRPVRVLIADKYETGDGSHVPALEELDLELDRHLVLDVAGIPICEGGGREVRGEVLAECEAAVVGNGTIEVELGYPESPLSNVSGDLTIYNRGRKPGGADLVAYAFIPPLIRNMVIPIKVRKNPGRYGWKARFEIPKLAGGAGSITSYSAHLGKRIFSATCPQGHMLARAVSTFADGSSRSEGAVRTCAMTEPHVRQ